MIAADTGRDEAERLAYIGRLATDFVFFIEELWKEIGSDITAPLGDMERDALRFVADSSNHWRGILAPRGVGKTFWGTAGYTAWRLLRDPDVKVLIVSKTKNPGASDTVKLIRGWLSNVWFLQHLDPKLNEGIAAADAIFRFTVNGAQDARSPSVQCQGIEGQLPNLRAHVVIADDVETNQNTKTVEARADLNINVNEFCNISQYGDKEVVYFGTYWHPESVYLKVAERGFVFRTYPFTYPMPGEKFLNLAPIVARRLADGTGRPGACTFSHRYGPHDIIERQAPGKMNWGMQHQLICNLTDTARYPIRLDDLIVFPVQRDKAPCSIAWGKTNDRAGTTRQDIQIVGRDGDGLFGPIMFDTAWAPYTATKGYIDPSGRGRDLTGFSVVSQLGSILWVKACYGLQGGGSSEKLDYIAQLARKHNVRDLYMEDNADTLGTYFPLLEAALARHFLEPGQDESYPQGWKCSLERDHATGQKEVRIIEALEPVISSHQLVVHPDCLTPTTGAPAQHELQYQLAYLTRDRGCFKEDGKIDSLAGCIRKFSDRLRVDPARASRAAFERLMADELKAHNKACLERFGRVQPQPRWFSNSR